MKSNKKPIGTGFKDISKEISVRVEFPSIFGNASFFLFFSLLHGWGTRCFCPFLQNKPCIAEWKSMKGTILYCFVLNVNLFYHVNLNVFYSIGRKL